MSSVRSNNTPSCSKIMRKESLTEGIAKLFCEIGYEKTSIRNIARALGIPGSALYYYFQNKQDMLFAVVDGLMEELTLSWENSSEVLRSAEEKLAQLIETHIKLYVENPYRGKVAMRDINCLEGTQKEIIRKKEVKYVNYAREVLTEIIEHSNSMMHPNIATFGLFGMLNSIYEWYSPSGSISPGDLARSFRQIILTGLQGHPVHACDSEVQT